MTVRSSAAAQVPQRAVERHSRLCAQAEAVAGGEGLSADARLTRLAAFVEARQEGGGLGALLGPGTLGGVQGPLASHPQHPGVGPGGGAAAGVGAQGEVSGAPVGDWVALEALVLACRSAASLQPDGTAQPASRCQVRAPASTLLQCGKPQWVDPHLPAHGYAG